MTRVAGLCRSGLASGGMGRKYGTLLSKAVSRYSVTASSNASFAACTRLALRGHVQFKAERRIPSALFADGGRENKLVNMLHGWDSSSASVALGRGGRQTTFEKY